MTNQESNEKGKLFVLSGPSGVGKGTVCKGLDLNALNTQISISMTTRKPREGEIDGVSYYFVSRDTFEKAIENHELLEYDEHFGNYYGTPKAPVKKLLDQGVNVLLEIETNGAKQVMSNLPQTVSIFMAPPSEEELKKRIIVRDSEQDEEIRDRLKKAKDEMKEMKSYKYVVVNDQIEQAISEVSHIMDGTFE